MIIQEDIWMLCRRASEVPYKLIYAILRLQFRRISSNFLEHLPYFKKNFTKDYCCYYSITAKIEQCGRTYNSGCRKILSGRPFKVGYVC